MASSSPALYSLQTKLMLAFAGIVLVALVLAGAVFVVLQRDEEEKQALDHVIAASPAIYSEFTVLQRRGDPESELSRFVEAAAAEHDVRMLLVARSGGTIAADSAGELTGEQVVFPREVEVQGTGRFQPYASWHPQSGTPGDDLIFVLALPSRLTEFRQMPPRGAEAYWVVLAVPETTIRGAWRDLLPGLGAAAAIALPIAVVLAVLVASYISRPLHQLTAASRRIAEGNYDVEVSIDRRDEVGRLAQAFSTMARRVGETHSQMRALIANVSHDLKTPLTSILGFAQALRDGGAQDDAATRHMGEVIHDEATRLSARLNDLLFLAELESGQSVLQRDEIDLMRLVEGAVRRIEADVAARNVRLDLDLRDVTISGDGAKLERAVENLLDNARKYTPLGGSISIRTGVDEGRARIEVANTAPDVTAEELPRLFERFYRRDRTRADTGGARPGTGLGLAIARDLIEMHGGTLQAELNGGLLVFTASLPMQERDA